ncbi:MAG: GTP-binding protein [Gammaproteobacteria bacterium]
MKNYHELIKWLTENQELCQSLLSTPVEANGLKLLPDNFTQIENDPFIQEFIFLTGNVKARLQEAVKVKSLPLECDQLTENHFDEKLLINAGYTKTEIQQLIELGAREIVLKKLADPRINFNETQSIDCIANFIKMGVTQSKSAFNQKLIFLLGTTGSGKTTAMNTLHGCEMEMLKLPNSYKRIIKVKDTSEIPPISEIGHGRISKTFMPFIVKSDTTGLLFADCPGFDDTRGDEIRIANAVNLSQIIHSAESARFIVFINYHTLNTDRAVGLVKLKQTLNTIFGSNQNLLKFRSSILIAVSHVPEFDGYNERITLEQLLDLVYQDEIIPSEFRQNTLIIDPLNNRKSEGCTRENWLQRIKSLLPMDSKELRINPAFSHEDMWKLTQVSRSIGMKISAALFKQNYDEAAGLLDNLCSIMTIGDEELQTVYQENCLLVNAHLAQIESNYYIARETKNLNDANVQLSMYEKVVCYFHRYLPSVINKFLEILEKHEQFIVKSCMSDIKLLSKKIFYEIQQRGVLEKHLRELYDLFYHSNPMIISANASHFLMRFFFNIAAIETTISLEVNTLQQYLTKFSRLSIALNKESQFNEVVDSIFLKLHHYASSIKLEYEKFVSKQLIEIKRELYNEMRLFISTVKWDKNGKILLNLIHTIPGYQNFDETVTNLSLFLMVSEYKAYMEKVIAAMLKIKILYHSYLIENALEFFDIDRVANKIHEQLLSLKTTLEYAELDEVNLLIKELNQILNNTDLSSFIPMMNTFNDLVFRIKNLSKSQRELLSYRLKLNEIIQNRLSSTLNKIAQSITWEKLSQSISGISKNERIDAIVSVLDIEINAQLNLIKIGDCELDAVGLINSARALYQMAKILAFYFTIDMNEIKRLKITWLKNFEQQIKESALDHSKLVQKNQFGTTLNKTEIIKETLNDDTNDFNLEKMRLLSTNVTFHKFLNAIEEDDSPAFSEVLKKVRNNQSELFSINKKAGMSPEKLFKQERLAQNAQIKLVDNILNSESGCYAEAYRLASRQNKIKILMKSAKHLDEKIRLPVLLLAIQKNNVDEVNLLLKASTKWSFSSLNYALQKAYEFEHDSIIALLERNGAIASGELSGSFKQIIASDNLGKFNQKCQAELKRFLSVRTINLVSFGSGGCGRTALTERFVTGRFNEMSRPTLNDKFRKYIVNNSEIYCLSIADVAGNESFTAYHKSHIEESDGFMLVFSLTARSTLEALVENIGQIRRVKDTHETPIIIVGNKSDLASERVISEAKAQEFAKKYGLNYIETSAKSGNNVNEAFEMLLQKVNCNQDQANLTESTDKMNELFKSQEHKFYLKVFELALTLKSSKILLQVSKKIDQSDHLRFLLEAIADNNINQVKLILSINTKWSEQSLIRAISEAVKLREQGVNNFALIALFSKNDIKIPIRMRFLGKQYPSQSTQQKIVYSYLYGKPMIGDDSYDLYTLEIKSKDTVYQNMICKLELDIDGLYSKKHDIYVYCFNYRRDSFDLDDLARIGKFFDLPLTQVPLVFAYNEAEESKQENADDTENIKFTFETAKAYIETIGAPLVVFNDTTQEGISEVINVALNRLFTSRPQLVQQSNNYPNQLMSDSTALVSSSTSSLTSISQTETPIGSSESDFKEENSYEDDKTADSSSKSFDEQVNYDDIAFNELISLALNHLTLRKHIFDFATYQKIMSIYKSAYKSPYGESIGTLKNVIEYRGILKLFQFCFSDAIDDFNQAISLDSDLLLSYFFRGIARLQLNQIEAGIADLKHFASEIIEANIFEDETSPITVELNGWGYFSPQLRTKSISHHILGLAYYLNKDYTNGVKLFSNAIIFNDCYIDAYFYRGLCHTFLNNLSSAIFDFQYILSLDPGNSKADLILKKIKSLSADDTKQDNANIYHSDQVILDSLLEQASNNDQLTRNTLPYDRRKRPDLWSERSRNTSEQKNDLSKPFETNLDWFDETFDSYYNKMKF